MQSKGYKRKMIYVLLLLGVLLEAIMELKFHRRFVFLWDDTWYATNIATGGPLQGLSDVLESQVWHYFNWGGRCINHGVLQLTLMCGELGADILNLAVTFLLCFLICEVAGRKDVFSYGLAFFSLIGLNKDIKLSIFWQSGAVNYLYSANWILLFLLLYIRQVKNPEAVKWKGIELWILPLGLIAGWSNENMGPMCFAISLVVMAHFKWWLKKRVPLWMVEGAVMTLCGSALMLLAPGNFVRKATGAELSGLEALYDRFFSMLMAGMSFLFPAILTVLLFLYIYIRVEKKLQPYQLVLMLACLLSYGAMILAPGFPNRAAFGIMVLCISLVLSFMQGIRDKTEKYNGFFLLFAAYMWLYGMYSLYAALRLPI